MPETLTLLRLEIAPSLAEQTYQAILKAILSFEIKPGDRLSVQRLSDQLGVSRTPVKEAFQRLEQEGLVSVVPRIGTFVSVLTARDIDEILEARALIEGFAAGRAARELTSKELEEAEGVLEGMGRALEEGRVAEAAEIGHGLHHIVLRTLDNSRLEGFLKQVELQYTRIRRIFSHEACRQRQSLDEHHGVLATLKDRNPEAAHWAMYNHHLSVRDDLVEAWTSVTEELGYPDDLIGRIELDDA